MLVDDQRQSRWRELAWQVPVRTLEELPGFHAGVALPPCLNRQGRFYMLRDHGSAGLISSLRAMPQASEECRGGDDEADDGTLLALELGETPSGRAHGGDRQGELGEGRRMEPILLALLPGDGRCVCRSELAGLPPR